jgi:hypothetical protein
MNYDDLLFRAKWESLSEDEIKSVADELQKNSPKTDPYKLLHILGRAGAVAYRKMVESYLGEEKSKEDPMMARLALQILCDFWGPTKNYLSDVKRFIKKVNWDIENNVRLIALSIAGEYLREFSDQELLQMLLSIFENQDEESIIRETAYDAIARAMGCDYNDLPPISEDMDWEKQINQDYIMKAKQKLIQGKE